MENLENNSSSVKQNNVNVTLSVLFFFFFFFFFFFSTFVFTGSHVVLWHYGYWNNANSSFVAAELYYIVTG